MDGLFELLDTDRDGKLSRQDLKRAAKRLEWHWNHAPLYAVLDLLTLSSPMTSEVFSAVVQEVTEDPRGVYGKTLRRCWGLYRKKSRLSTASSEAGVIPNPVEFTDRIGRLEQTAGKAAAKACRRLFGENRPVSVAVREAALLIIDPQISFTEGAWMQSIGPGAVSDTAPIRSAFEGCRNRLQQVSGHVEAAFTRCPFPPGSYGWDRRLAPVLKNDQPYFLKPGNSVLIPSTNGFAWWLNACISAGRQTLVVGGCTLNSCVRVSAVEILQAFGSRNLRLVVDLSLCGARTRNYLASAQYGGDSAVDSAVAQMKAAGVQVAGCVQWVGSAF